ncbi:CHAT domain-containing protein [Peristeroidobacter soli]|uniref:CHAT domain-containing protein n=1 Tax=Peristeroidobacter soli TaxID=2497877 RepID=UPI00101DAD61|nr:CHAT domain-containing protein [Peristeroidobacter soli]
MGERGDATIASAKGAAPRRPTPVRPPKRVYVVPSLDLAESSDGEVPEGADDRMDLGHDYEVILTLQSSEAAPDAIAIEGDTSMSLVWQGAAALEVLEPELLVGPSDVDNGACQWTFTVRVPRTAARCIGQFGLKVARERTLRELSKIAISGNYYAPPAELGERAHVNLAFEPDERFAIINVTANGDALDLSCYHAKTGHVTTTIPQPPLSLVDVERDGGSAMNVYTSVLEYSRASIHGLLRWLNRVIECTQGQVSLLICEHADSRVPWEMLVLRQGGMPLGALIEVTRWTAVFNFSEAVRLDPQERRHLRGGVVRYIDAVRLKHAAAEVGELDSCEHVECESNAKLVKTLRTLPPDIAMVFMACHGVPACDAEHRKELRKANLKSGAVNSLDFEVLDAPKMRPAMIVNACHSARLTRTRLGVAGLPAFFLSYFSETFVGTLGAVDDRHAAEIGAKLLRQARRPDGVRLAKFLRELREDAVKNFDGETGAARFVSSFMYVQYGSVGFSVGLKERGAKGDRNG